MLFILLQKLISFSSYLDYCLDFHVAKRLDQKDKGNLARKWQRKGKNDCNTHIAQYLEK